MDCSQDLQSTAPGVFVDRHDRDIRDQLHRWLARKHSAEPETAILHEFEIPRPSARIDIALINGRLGGYEIKGAADTLTRLFDQEKSFSSVFERMTLVVATRHIAKAKKVVPDWWEIVEVGAQGFQVRRRGKANPNLQLENLLYVLTKAELRNVETGLGTVSHASKANKSAAVTAIMKKNRPYLTRKLVKTELKRRSPKLLS